MVKKVTDQVKEQAHFR